MPLYTITLVRLADLHLPDYNAPPLNYSTVGENAPRK